MYKLIFGHRIVQTMVEASNKKYWKIALGTNKNDTRIMLMGTVPVSPLSNFNIYFPNTKISGSLQ